MPQGLGQSPLVFPCLPVPLPLFLPKFPALTQAGRDSLMVPGHETVQSRGFWLGGGVGLGGLGCCWVLPLLPLGPTAPVFCHL